MASRAKSRNNIVTISPCERRIHPGAVNVDKLCPLCFSCENRTVYCFTDVIVSFYCIFNGSKWLTPTHWILLFTTSIFIYLHDSIWKIMPRRANFKIWKKKIRKTFISFWLNEECIVQKGSRLFPYWIVRGRWGGSEFFRLPFYVWYLQYWTLCYDLEVFKLWAGIMCLSFLIDNVP